MPVLADFEGDWRLSRRIVDYRSGAEGRLTGLCTFQREGALLRCSERGELVFGGTALQAERVYLWREDAGLIAVDYNDGRPFHLFNPKGHVARADHDCAPDRYEGEYDFGAWPRWQVTWRVRGPRKDYLSVSEFENMP